MTDEIQKTEDPRRASLVKARAARAANRAAAAATGPIGSPPRQTDDAYSTMQQAQQTMQQAQENTLQAPQGVSVAGLFPTQEGVAAARTPVRGRTEVIGRGGEKLSRGHLHSQDMFDVPEHMIPKGWEYQWNVITVVGNADIARDQSHIMHQSGWRPVPAERHAGILVPANSRGDIMRGGMRLEERPAILSQEARAEDLRLAKQLISDRNDALKLSGVRKNMPDGFEMSQQYRGTGGDIRMSIDRALDAPAPSHKIADPGE